MLPSRRQLLAPVLLASWAPGAARAQTWPARPVRLLVGYSPAGTTDIAGRLIAERLTARLGQRSPATPPASSRTIVGAAWAAMTTPAAEAE